MILGHLDDFFGNCENIKYIGWNKKDMPQKRKMYKEKKNIVKKSRKKKKVPANKVITINNKP